jgi:PAS domain S-box-containing protein
MNDEQFKQEIQEIHQQLTILQDYMVQLSPRQLEQVAEVIRGIFAALDNLLILNEETHTSLGASAVVEEELLGQNEQESAQRQYYYDLFQFSPDACIVTDANGLILEANWAIAKLLKVPQSYLIGKQLAVFIALGDQHVFRIFLNQLSQVKEVQNCELSLCPNQGKPFVAQLKVAVSYNDSGFIKALQIGVHDISEYKRIVTQPTQPVDQQAISAQASTPLGILPQVLDGLQVLLVDDEADAREFMTAVLKSYGIQVRAVATVAAALEALNTFYPDVLVSDIRMPDENGYSLIRKLRELEAQKGRHIPSAALTAYLTEDREKALAAGFESHLHKLAQPTELVEMVARLAGRTSN